MAGRIQAKSVATASRSPFIDETTSSWNAALFSLAKISVASDEMTCMREIFVNFRWSATESKGPVEATQLHPQRFHRGRLLWWGWPTVTSARLNWASVIDYRTLRVWEWLAEYAGTRGTQLTLGTICS